MKSPRRVGEAAARRKGPPEGSYDEQFVVTGFSRFDASNDGDAGEKTA
jgi:hypothetical protein